MAVNETKRELKRAYLNYGRLFDPIAVFALILLVVIPIFAVINLSTNVLPPVYKTNLINNDPNVLGTKSDNTFGIELTSGTHTVIQTTLLDEVDPNRYLYKTNILKHETGTYSRPILNLYNNTNHPVLVSISPSGITGSSLINTILDSSRMRIYSSANGLRLISYTLQPDEQKELYLEVYSTENVNFKEELSLDIFMSTEDIK